MRFPTRENMQLSREHFNGSSVSVAHVLMPPGMDIDIGRHAAEISSSERAKYYT
jgi:hypothetical protein